MNVLFSVLSVGASHRIPSFVFEHQQLFFCSTSTYASLYIAAHGRLLLLVLYCSVCVVSTCTRVVGMWLEVAPVQYCEPQGTPLRHSASFSCLSRGGGTRVHPHRARTATLPSATLETDYGFVRHRTYKYGPVVEEEYEEDVSGSKKELSSIREVLIKKSASLLSPTAWWSPRSRRARKDDRIEEEEQQQRRWRSLGALLRTGSVPQPPQAPSPRAQSFYLLDDFLRPQQKGRREKATSSSDSLELSSPMPPPVPPPPPPLRLLRYRPPCDCLQCRRERDIALLNDTVGPTSCCMLVMGFMFFY